MKRKFKQWWSSILPISTKWTFTSNHPWTDWTQKTTTYDIENPGPGLKQAYNVAGLNRLMGPQP